MMKKSITNMTEDNLNIFFRLITLNDNEEKFSCIAFTEKYTNYIKRFWEINYNIVKERRNQSVLNKEK